MNLLRAEWTKLRSVPRWMVTLLLAALLTVGVSMLGAASSNTDINEKPNFVTGPNGDPVADEFAFAHQPVTGDVTITVRVASVDSPPPMPAMGPTSMKKIPAGPWTDVAGGVMIKDGTRSGSSYAAVLLTNTNGVRMQSDFADDISGSTSSGTRWLRLTRTGNTITGYESADGTSWQQIGVMKPKALPATAEVGFYLSAAPELRTSRGMGGSSVGAHSFHAAATFDSVALSSTATPTWRADQLKMPSTIRMEQEDPPPGGKDPNKGPDRQPPPVLAENDGTFTVHGTGMVGPNAPDDDVVEAALLGVIAGLMALIAVGVLFATSEYRKGMIRATFAATPKRGRVLAAKALVLGAVAFVLSLASLLASFLLALPILKKHGMGPPAFPTPSLSDGTVLRALLLSALFMTGVTVFAFAVGMLLRRSAAAITLTIVLVVLPLIAGSVLPGSSPRWLMYTTLAGGMSTLRAKPPTQTLAEPWAMISPWAGIGVVLAYAAVALGLAWWRLRRRDA